VLLVGRSHVMEDGGQRVIVACVRHVKKHGGFSNKTAVCYSSSILVKRDTVCVNSSFFLSALSRSNYETCDGRQD
jgi:hypothetical protein